MDLSETTGALHAFNIPLLAVGDHSPSEEKFARYDNILSTAADLPGQARVTFLK